MNSFTRTTSTERHLFRHEPVNSRLLVVQLDIDHDLGKIKIMIGEAMSHTERLTQLNAGTMDQMCGDPEYLAAVVKVYTAALDFATERLRVGKMEREPSNI